MTQCSTTKIDSQANTGNTGKQACLSIEKIKDALNEILPSIEDTAPNMEQKAEVDEFEGPCPFCGGEDRFVVFPGEMRIIYQFGIIGIVIINFARNNFRGASFSMIYQDKSRAIQDNSLRIVTEFFPIPIIFFSGPKRGIIRQG